MTGASASEETDASGQWQYVLEDGSAMIVKFLDYDYYGDLLIPSDLDGYMVTGIDSGAFFAHDLVRVTIPDSVTSIGSNPFRGCSLLTYINVSSSNPTYAHIDGILFDKQQKMLVSYPAGKKGAYTVPEGILLIGDSAFDGYYGSGLTSVVIPNTVTSIGDLAFYMCKNLTSATIPDSVTSIGRAAFGYTNLTSVIIPDGVTSIGDGVFTFCESLTSVDIPDSVASIGRGAFSSSGLVSIIIPDSVTNIGEEAFGWCSGLTNIAIGNSVKSIGDRAFYECSKLTSVTIPDSVTSIGESAFLWCSGLASMTIPNSVTSIGNNALAGCDSLTLSVAEGSVAEQYAKDNGIPYVYASVRTPQSEPRSDTTMPSRHVSSLSDQRFNQALVEDSLVLRPVDMSITLNYDELIAEIERYNDQMRRYNTNALISPRLADNVNTNTVLSGVDFYNTVSIVSISPSGTQFLLWVKTDDTRFALVVWDELSGALKLIAPASGLDGDYVSKGMMPFADYDDDWGFPWFINDSGISWSTDGRYIAISDGYPNYNTGNGTVLIDAEKGEARPLVSLPYPVIWPSLDESFPGMPVRAVFDPFDDYLYYESTGAVYERIDDWELVFENTISRYDLRTGETTLLMHLGGVNGSLDPLLWWTENGLMHSFHIGLAVRPIGGEAKLVHQIHGDEEPLNFFRDAYDGQVIVSAAGNQGVSISSPIGQSYIGFDNPYYRLVLFATDKLIPDVFDKMTVIQPDVPPQQRLREISLPTGALDESFRYLMEEMDRTQSVVPVNAMLSPDGRYALILTGDAHNHDEHGAAVLYVYDIEKQMCGRLILNDNLLVNNLAYLGESYHSSRSSGFIQYSHGLMWAANNRVLLFKDGSYRVYEFCIDGETLGEDSAEIGPMEELPHGVRFADIKINASGDVQTMRVLVDDESLVYIDVMSLGDLTDYRAVSLRDGATLRYVRPGQDTERVARRAFKRVDIMLEQGRIAYVINQNAATYLPLGDTHQVGERTYVRADVVLPLLNVTPFLENDTLVLISDYVTMADVMTFLDGYEFDQADMVRDDALFRVLLGINNLADRSFNMRLTGSKADYEQIFEGMLTSATYPLEKSDPTLFESVRGGLGLRSNTFFDAFEGEDTAFLYQYYKWADNLDTMGELVAEVQRSLSEAGGSSIDLPISTLARGMEYLNISANMVLDHYEMLDAAFRLGNKHTWKGLEPKRSMRNGANTVWRKYSNTFGHFSQELLFEAITKQTSESAFTYAILGGNGLHGAILSASKVLLNEAGGLKLVDTSRKLALLRQYVDVSDFSREQIDALSQWGDAISEKGLEDIRLTAMLYLLANRGCYEAMLAASQVDDALSPGRINLKSTFEQQQIEKIDMALQILALAKGSVTNDSLVNYDEQTSELRHMLEALLQTGPGESPQGTSGLWLYEVKEGTAIITGSQVEMKGDLLIPREVDGNMVTGIGEKAFYWYSDLTSVTIPMGVTSIGYGAFMTCRRITNVTIPDSVTSIDSMAFAVCDALTEVIIPRSVTHLGDSVFYNCEALVSITFPDSVTSIGDSMCYDSRALTNITIPDSVTSIGDHAFYWCVSLTDITIPDSVTSIGKDAFAGCNKLTLSVKQGSFAEQYAKDNGIPYVFSTDTALSVGYPGTDSLTPLKYTTEFDSSIVPACTRIDFMYSDAFFANKSDEENADLAKASVALACASYVRKERGYGIAKTLDDMGFLDIEQTFPTTTENEPNKAGFTIGHKPISAGGKSYELICFAIRGTPQSAEWFSDFSVGEYGDDHWGFSETAKYLEERFDAYIGNHADQLQNKELKIWVFGHSRGGALANLLAYRWNNTRKYADMPNIYAYTFAAPRVTTKADKKAANIFNYVNPGDTITQFPLAAWGYGWHGRIIELNGEKHGVAHRFHAMFGMPYEGLTSESTVVKDLKSWVPTRASYYYIAKQDSLVGLIQSIVKPPLNFSPRDMMMDLAAFQFSKQDDADMRFNQFIKRLAMCGSAGRIALLHFGWDTSELPVLSNIQPTKRFAHSHCQELYIAWMDAMYESTPSATSHLNEP